jgi:TRAP-type C4-dicarboxylate transport system permease small subunit
MKAERRKRSFLDVLLDFFGGATAIIIVFTMLAVIYEVAMRYFIDRPTFWVLEVVEWCLVWITFLSAAWVLKEDRHVTMDIVVAGLNPKARIVLGVITSAIGALICLTMTFYGAQVVYDHFARGVVEAKVLKAPKAPLLVIIPAGFFLLFIQFIRRILNLCKNGRSA